MTFEQAVEIAARELAGIEDRFGEPELLHVLRVARDGAGGSARRGRAARVLEDSDVTVEDLRAPGVERDRGSRPSSC